MAQGAIDLFLKSKNFPVRQNIPNTVKPDEDEIDLISDSTTATSDEIEKPNIDDESFELTELDLSSSIVDIHHKSSQKHFKHGDIMKSFDKSTSKQEITEPISSEDDQVILLDSSPVKPKSGITALHILTGNKKKLPVQNIAEEASESYPTTEISLMSDEEDDDIVCTHSAEIKSSKISAKDLLIGKKKKDEELIEVLSDEESSLLDQKKMNVRKNKTPKKKLIIHFKYKPHKQKIMELELKMKGSLGKSMSSKDFLSGFNQAATSAIAESDTINTKAPTSGIASILSGSKFLRNNPISKMKEIDPLEIGKENYHIKYEHPLIQHRSITLPLKPEIIKEDIDLSLIPSKLQENPIPNPVKFIEVDEDISLYEIAKTKITNIKEKKYFRRFVKLFKEGHIPSCEPWTTTFRPHRSDDILMDHKTLAAVKLWLSNSFTILKKSTKRPDFKKYKKNRADLDDFIVDDYDSEGTEDDEYVPLMIIHGPTGVGKTSAVYAIAEELNGYIHEINTSQNRSRKDILGHLKELSTTQLVHRNQELVDTNEFQKGVILFEDVDILLEQDKGFWSVIQNLVTISRRPIIITCSDLNAIPSEILELAEEQRSLFEFKRQSLKLLKMYLFLVALTHKIVTDEEVLNEILVENQFDLKGSLNSLQFLCKPIRFDALTRIELLPKIENRTKLEDIKTLKGYAQLMDLESVTDIIEKNQYSLLRNHVDVEFDTTDLKLIEDEPQEDPLYFEFDFNAEIQDYLPVYPSFEAPVNPRILIERDREFYRSKLKISKRSSGRRITSAMVLEFYHDNDNYEDEVFDTLPPGTYISEVSPIIREFARYDSKVEKATNIDGDDGVATNKKFNGDPKPLLTGSLVYWGQSPNNWPI